MTKDKIKEIEQKYNMWADDFNLDPQDVEWLINQAIRVEELESQVENWQKGRYLAVSTIDKERELKKRVQELKEENKQIRQMKYHEAYEQGKFDTNMKVWYEIPKLEQQNKRYREQLELIRKDTFYEEHEFVSVRHLIRKRVDKALEGEE